MQKNTPEVNKCIINSSLKIIFHHSRIYQINLNRKTLEMLNQLRYLGIEKISILITELQKLSHFLEKKILWKDWISHKKIF